MTSLADHARYLATGMHECASDCPLPPASGEPRTVFGMTREEWYAEGNPPGSFEEVIRMAERNTEQIRRAARSPHPWDGWDVNAPEDQP